MPLEVFLFRLLPIFEVGPDGENDSPFDGIDLDQLHGNRVALLEELSQFPTRRLLSHLTDGHEALVVLREIHHQALLDHLGDGGVDFLAHIVDLGDVAPGILLNLLHAQADATIVLIDIQDHYLDLVALFHHL